MSASAIYLLRHGDSRQDDVKRYIGQTDLPLNATGQAQARFWQRELAATQFQRILCSDLSRSIETARIIAEGHPQQLEIVSDLREINLGLWDGLPVDQIRCNNPDEYRKRGATLADHRPPGGESFNDLADRVLPLFDRIIADSTGTLLIVAHAGVNRIILCHILGLPRTELFTLKQEYGSLNIIDCSATCRRLRQTCTIPLLQTGFS
jgi:probable phosphoglycerate mutase